MRHKTILDFSRRLAEQFKPQKIILFGSRAYGRPHRDSDVDLLVIMRYRRHPMDLSLRMLNLLDPRFPIDLIVRTPREIARQYREFDPPAREAIDKGKVLFSRSRHAKCNTA